MGSRHDIAFDDLNLLRQGRRVGRLVGAPDTGRRKFDAGDKLAVTFREVARGTPKAGAGIRDLPALLDSRGGRQHVVRLEPPIVILIVPMAVLGAQSVQIAACARGASRR